MEWLVDNSNDAGRAKTISDPMLRHLKVPLTAAGTPLKELPHGPWLSAAPSRTGGFSAVGFYFAEYLRERDPSVAIGLVNSSWGGSRIEAWLPAVAGSTAAKHTVPAESRASWKRLQTQFPQAFDEGGLPGRPHQAGGVPTDVGRKWEWTGYPDIDGQIWLDRTVNVQEDQLNLPATLVLGPIDDSDSTFVNGTLVGNMQSAYAKTRRYRIPDGLLKAGDNAVSVWVEDTGGGGGLYQSPDSIYLQLADERIALGHDGWRSRPQRLYVDSLGEVNHRPANLYNAMLYPLAGLKASAVLWYQGESNAGGREEAQAYSQQMVSLTKTFRALTAQPQLPMLVVELPDFTAAYEGPFAENDWWPIVRSSQRAVYALPPAATVVTLGLGNAEDIHPRDKRPVGERLANQARRLVYGESDRPVSARALGLDYQGNSLVVRFADAGTGMQGANGSPIRGFAVRDKAGRWHHADAESIGSDRVRIDAPAGIEPRAVAYAWANNPVQANLRNSFGLPVSSFMLSLDE